MVTVVLTLSAIEPMSILDNSIPSEQSSFVHWTTRALTRRAFPLLSTPIRARTSFTWLPGVGAPVLKKKPRSSTPAVVGKVLLLQGGVDACRGVIVAWMAVMAW